MGIPAPIGLSASGLPNSGDQANAVVSGQITAIGPQPPFAFRGPMNLEIYASINTTLTTTTGSLSSTVASATGLAVGTAINSTNVPPGTTIGVLSGTTVTLAPSSLTFSGTIDSSGKITGQFPSDRILGATVTIPANSEYVSLPVGTTVRGIVQSYIAATANSPGRPSIIQLSNAPSTLPPENNQVPFLFAPTGNCVTVSGADTAAIFTGATVTFSGTVQLERSFDGGNTFVLCNIGVGTLAQFNAGTPINITFGEPEKNVLYRLNCIAFTSGEGASNPINYRISQTGGAAESLAIGPLSNG